MWCVNGKDGGETTRHLILFIFSVLMLEPLKYTERISVLSRSGSKSTQLQRILIRNRHVEFKFDLLGKELNKPQETSV
jgi:hypothetical protein